MKRSFLTVIMVFAPSNLARDDNFCLVNVKRVTTLIHYSQADGFWVYLTMPKGLLCSHPTKLDIRTRTANIARQDQ